LDGLALPAAGCDNTWPIGGGFGRSLFGLSLCAGAGGLDLGLHIATPGYRTVGYVERDAYAAATLVARMEDAALDCAPVWDNVAGRKLGDKDPRHLWPHIARIVREVEPSICFFENVGGHLRLGFEQVHDDLRSMGYRVKAGLFTAEEVGAPHKRERLFILAYAESARERREAGDVSETHGRQDGKMFQLAYGANSVVADSHGNGCQGQICPQPRQDDPQGSAECAADTRSRGDSLAAEGFSLQQGGSESGETRPALPDSARSLADPACAGTRQHQFGSRFEPERGQQDVGDAHGTGLEGRDVEGNKRSDEWSPFPPGPADRFGWERILERAPHLEPAVRGGADGLAHRVDRLRLCGNGVVPLVAAYAFRTLAADTNIDIEGI